MKAKGGETGGPPLDCYPYTFSPLLLFAQGDYFDKVMNLLPARALCFVLCALCFVLCALCFVLCVCV